MAKRQGYVARMSRPFCASDLIPSPLPEARCEIGDRKRKEFKIFKDVHALPHTGRAVRRERMFARATRSTGMTVDENDDLELTIMVQRPSAWELWISNSSPVALRESGVKLGRRPSKSGPDGDTQLVQLIDPTRTISRNHARLTCVGGQWFVKDLGSANGVVIGDTADATPITPGLHVVNSATFWLGDIALQIRDTTADTPSGDDIPEQRDTVDDAHESPQTAGSDGTPDNGNAKDTETKTPRPDETTSDATPTTDTAARVTTNDASDTGGAYVAHGNDATLGQQVGDMTVCGFCGELNPATLGLCRNCGVTLRAPKRRDVSRPRVAPVVDIHDDSAPATPPAQPQLHIPGPAVSRPTSRRLVVVLGIIGGVVAASLMGALVYITVAVLL